MTAGSQLRPPHGRLPAELTEFVGRRAEVGEVKRLLAGCRLVTLTGMGGCGKTRLALRVAEELRRGFADGVWQVDLAPLTDDAMVGHTIAETLGIADVTRRRPVDAIVDFLRNRQLLLVLDNCEHLLDGCAGFAGRSLRGVPGLRLLCTSRQSLGVVGEQVFTASPLAYPERGRPLAPVEALRYPAVALFVTRAVAVLPGFVLTEANSDTVARICCHLDGLPLAIELAATRLRVLTIEQLATTLRDGFPDLGTRHATPPWHRTLDAAFGWSYGLCSPAERAAWARISVFVDSFELSAAEEVCAGPELAADDLLEQLSGLVDKSVLLREDDTGVTPRYRLPTTVRGYGLERLRAEGATGNDVAELTRGHHDGCAAELALRRRHRDWYQRLAERFDAAWFGPDQLAWADRIQADLPNLRAALTFCLTVPGEVRTGQRLAAHLAYFWQGRGPLHEGDRWFGQLLDADGAPTPERWEALSAHCHVLIARGELGPAAARAGECLELARQLDDPHFVAWGTYNLGVVQLMCGRVTEALPLLEQAATAFGEQGDAAELANAKLAQAVAALHQPDLARAEELLAECRAICHRHGDQWWLGFVLVCSALAALTVGDTERAGGYLRESLHNRHTRRDTAGLAGSLELLAWISAAGGHHERAARLVGAADRQWALVGHPPYDAALWLRRREECENRLRARLGARRYERTLAIGAALDVDEAVRYALQDDDRGGSAGAPQVERRPGPAGPATGEPAPVASPLTTREAEVAALIAEGRSNKEIAARLVLSRRTAEGHVENILRKLGFTSRTQVASWLAQQTDG